MPYVNITADGDTELSASAIGGYMEFDVKGSFGGGTLTINVVKDGESYTRATFTEAGNVGALMGTNKDVVVTLSGATAPDIDFHYQRLANY